MKILKYFFNKFFNNWPVKIGGWILIFLLSGNVIASQSGITDQLAKIFYWPIEQRVGQVAGEYSVNIAATAVSNFTINQNKFFINGRETFLLGASVFDALNWEETKMATDLDYLGQHNYNLIRIWADWQWQDSYENNPGSDYYHRLSTVYDTTKKDGSLDAIKIEKLKKIIDQAGNRGIIVDLVITDFNPSYYIAGESNQSLLIKHQKAATEITTALRGKVNLFFDLMNEHDNSGHDYYLAFPDHGDIKKIAEAVRAADSSRYITVSNRGVSSMDQTQIASELTNINNSIYAPHLMRTEDWWSKTGERISTVKSILNNLSPAKNIPIYLGEEQYFDADTNQAHFVGAAKQAKDGGAVGWVFHQLAGFDLKNGKTFKDQLGNNGRAILEAIGNNLADGCGVKVYTDSWTSRNASDYKEIPICGSAQAGYVEFEVTNINFDNMPQKAYSLVTVLDKSAVFKNSQNPNYISFLLYGRETDYKGYVKYRANINNDCNDYQCHPEDDGLPGRLCSDDKELPNDPCPMAREFYQNYPDLPWENRVHRFKIEWGGGINNKHVIYSFWNGSGWTMLRDWDLGQVAKTRYQNFSWLASNMVLRLGHNTIYSGIPGAVYKNITVKTFGGTGIESCADQSGRICQLNQGCSTGGFTSASDTDHCCLGNCINMCPTGYQLCQSGQNCSGSWHSTQINCCYGTCTGTPTPPTSGQPDLIKIDGNARNPAVDVDSMGNLHIAYNCGQNLCYAKVTSEKGEVKVNNIFTREKSLAVSGDARVRVDKNNYVHISHNNGYAVIKPDGTLGAKKDNMYVVYDRSTIINRMDVDSQGNAYILYQYGQIGEYKNGNPPDNIFRSIRLKKMKYANGNITQEWEKIIDQPCSSQAKYDVNEEAGEKPVFPKRMTPGNIRIDENDIAHISWRTYDEKADSEPDTCKKGIWYANMDLKQNGSTLSANKHVFGATSDYSDLEIDNEGNVYLAATSAWGGSGFLYREINNGNLDSNIYKIYSTPETKVVLNASERFGEANTLCPSLKYDNEGKLYMSFAGAGNQEFERRLEWKGVGEYVVDPSCRVGTDYACISEDKVDRLLTLENNPDYEKQSCASGGFTIKSKSQPDREYKFGCWSANYYVAYYTSLDNLKININNLPPLNRFTPLNDPASPRTKESDQGTQESNPIIGKAWGQGVFMVFEDDYGHPGTFDVYLKAVGGAVVGMPVMKADFNCDGKIDVIDFGILLSHWNKSGALIENYLNGETCKKNLNLDRKAPAKITETDFPGLLGCWTKDGQKPAEICFE